MFSYYTKYVPFVNKTQMVIIESWKDGDMEINIIAQFLFWVLLGLWYLGAKFPYMELIIGVIALVNGLLLVI